MKNKNDHTSGSKVEVIIESILQLILALAVFVKMFSVFSCPILPGYLVDIHIHTPLCQLKTQNHYGVINCLSPCHLSLA